MKKRFVILLVYICMLVFAAGSAMAANLPDEAALNAKTSAILDYLNLSGEGDYEKIFSVYNYICQTVEYDWEVLDAPPEWDGVSTGYGQTAYEALCGEKAVCAGISEAITLLLNKLGVPCKTVIGFAPSGIAHAWNLVKLDGQWYFLDATNDLNAENYSAFLKCWSDLGDYRISSENGLNISDYNLASTSYPGSATARLDSCDGFSFNAGLGDITIVAYSGSEENLVIPAELNGRKVKRLTKYCIYENSSLKTLVVSEGIENVSSLFVSSCPYLTSISLPSTARLPANTSDSIVTGMDGFVEYCYAMETVTVAAGNPWLRVIDNTLYTADLSELIYYPPQSKLTALHIADGVKKIRSEAFAGNAYLKEIVLPESVTSIGYWAFSGCGSLEKANIPANCMQIGQYAFQSTKVSEVHIPAKAVCVFPAFSSVLEKLTVDENNPNYYAVDNVLFTRDGKLAVYAARKPDTSYTVPDHVTTIEMHAFDNASNLKHIALSEGIRDICEYAFYGCTGLTEITIPESVTTISSGAFFDCRSLGLVVIPASVTEINGSYVFANAESVIIVGEPGSAALTWADANGFLFRDASLPWDVSGTCDNIAWSLSEDGVLHITGTGAIQPCCSDAWAPYATCVKSVIIDEGITAVGSSAFARHFNLESISLPQSVTEIGNRSFAGCRGLKNIDLSDGLTSLLDFAFLDCSMLESIDLPDTLTDLREGVFYGCTSLKCVTLPEKTEYAGYQLFKDCTSLESVTLPDGLLGISPCAFENCTALTSVDLPASLVWIQDNAFSGCSALSSLTIRSDTLPAIGIDVFPECDLTVYCHLGTDVEAWAVSNGFRAASLILTDGVLPDDYMDTMRVLSLPAQVTVIEAEAFMHLPVQVVLLPSTCTSIGSRAFADCTALVYVRLPEDATVADDAFEGCSDIFFVAN